jgi:hypothetical protein
MPWQGACNPAGYGIFPMQENGTWKARLANRVAWELVHGQLLHDMQALHHCDNPPCVSGWHVYRGTQQQNMLDAQARGRTTWPYVAHAFGEKHPLAKLQENDIHVIWTLHTQGWTPQAIADILHVSSRTITSVLQRKTWRHIDISISAKS